MEHNIIEEARSRFDPELHTDEYKRIHRNDDQLDQLIQYFEVKENDTYFDLGTGNGYVGFELAKRHRNTTVIGVDIARNSIEKNNEIAHNSHIPNISFITYEGVKLPFEDGLFNGGISRYAMHHFPNIHETIQELNRILKLDGFFIFSDPKTYDTDINNFIDNYQQLKPDGHVHFYREDEIDALFKECNFVKEKSFASYSTYPRELDERYHHLLDSEKKEIHDTYKIRIEGERIYITVEIMNIFYRKKSRCA